jgi:hypothetical protein
MFVRNSCLDPKSLETVSGAAALMQAAELDAHDLFEDGDDF